MKLLLLITLLTAGTTAHSIGRRALRQFYDMLKCIIPGNDPLLDIKNYGFYCTFGRTHFGENELETCCQTIQDCYIQFMDMVSCKSLRNTGYTSSHSFSCSGNEVTCSDKNNPCEDFICNCVRQAAICFTQAPYNKEYKGVHY